MNNDKLMLLTMLTSEIESILAIFMLIPTTTGGPKEKKKQTKRERSLGNYQLSISKKCTYNEEQNKNLSIKVEKKPNTLQLVDIYFTW